MEIKLIKRILKREEELLTYSVGEVIPRFLLKIPDNLKDSNFYILEKGSPKKFLEGKRIVIQVSSYVINKKEYLLTDSYGIEAILSGNHVFPVLRDAKGKEREVFKSKKITRLEVTTKGPINYFWPSIVKIK